MSRFSDNINSHLLSSYYEAARRYAGLINLPFQSDVKAEIDDDPAVAPSVRISDNVHERRAVAPQQELVLAVAAFEPHSAANTGEPFAADRATEELNAFKPLKIGFEAHRGHHGVVTQRDIEENPKKIAAILDLPSPKNTREVQRLTGRIAALNRFISRSTDKCLPFYELLRGIK